MNRYQEEMLKLAEEMYVGKIGKDKIKFDFLKELIEKSDSNERWRKSIFNLVKEPELSAEEQEEVKKQYQYVATHTSFDKEDSCKNMIGSHLAYHWNEIDDGPTTIRKHMNYLYEYIDIFGFSCVAKWTDEIIATIDHIEKDTLCDNEGLYYNSTIYKSDLVHKGESMLTYITSIYKNKEELMKHILPNLGFKPGECQRIINGTYTNEGRILRAFNKLIYEIMESIKDKNEKKRVFSYLGFSTEEMVQYKIIPPVDGQIKIEDMVILKILDRLDGDPILDIIIHKTQEEIATQIINQAEKDWYEDSECSLHYQYESDIDLIKSRLDSSNIIFNDIVHYTKA